MSATTTVGRTRKYHTPEEKSEAQRHNALLHYHRKKALNKIIEGFKENYNFESEYVYVLHGDKVEDANYIIEEIKQDEKFNNVNFIVDYLGVIVGAHGGPGNICLCYTAKMR